jgi:peroxiredoxin Q/BCP
MITRILASAIALSLSVAVSSADDTKLKVKEGDKFPSVELTAVQAEKVKPDAKTLKIDDLKGKTVVVFFYPKALTGG